MENDKEEFKKEFRRRLYSFALQLIEFIDHLPADNVSKRLQAARKISQTISPPPSNPATKASFGLLC
jgi:hypothetical protein